MAQEKIEFRGSPEDLTGKAKGIVFEMTLAEGDNSIPEGEVPADNPTFEEAYPAFMAARGRETGYSGEEKE